MCRKPHCFIECNIYIWTYTYTRTHTHIYAFKKIVFLSTLIGFTASRYMEKKKIPNACSNSHGHIILYASNTMHYIYVVRLGMQYTLQVVRVLARTQKRYVRWLIIMKAGVYEKYCSM